MKIRGRENLSNFKGIVITVCQDGHEKNDTSGLNDIVMLELTIENATVGCWVEEDVNPNETNDNEERFNPKEPILKIKWS